jgi:hypothetical protein
MDGREGKETSLGNGCVGQQPAISNGQRAGIAAVSIHLPDVFASVSTRVFPCAVTAWR